MNRFTVAARLWFMIALFAGVILVGTLIGMGGTSLGVKSTEQMYQERTLPSQLIAEVESLSLESRLEVAAALQTPKDEVIAQSIRVVGENSQKIDQILARFDAIARSPDVDGHYRDFRQALAAYRKDALDPSISMLKEGDLVEVKSIVVKKARPLFAAVKKALGAINQGLRGRGPRLLRGSA